MRVKALCGTIQQLMGEIKVKNNTNDQIGYKEVVKVDNNIDSEL